MNRRAYVDEEKEGVKYVLDDAAVKFKLFMAHKIICAIQQRVMDEAQKEMVQVPCEELGIVVTDYKMKYIPKMYRQKTTEFYGLEGVIWHGFVVTYRRKDVDGMDDQSIDRDKVVLKKLYLDHVCIHDTDQNTYAIC